MRLFSTWMLSGFLCVGLLSCGIAADAIKDGDTEAVKLTRLFTNIDVGQLQTTSRECFEGVSSAGLQANTKPGTAGGYLTITPPGWRLQRFQLGGEITAQGLEELLSKLKSELSALVVGNGARIIGRIGDAIQDRPIFCLTLVLPRVVRPGDLGMDLRGLVGFYMQYADAGGIGAIDVMAIPTGSDGDAESWYMGLMIHEPAPVR